MLDELKTPADLEADPAVADQAAKRLEAAMDMFAFIWMAYLAQWGPKVGTRGRKHHHWRLHQLLELMSDLEEISGAGDETWDPFRDKLLGFGPYWADRSSYDLHHET